MSYANKSPRLEGILVASIPSSVFLYFVHSCLLTRAYACAINRRHNDNSARASTHSLHAAQLILEPG